MDSNIMCSEVTLGDFIFLPIQLSHHKAGNTTDLEETCPYSVADTYASIICMSTVRWHSVFDLSRMSKVQLLHVGFLSLLMVPM